LEDKATVSDFTAFIDGNKIKGTIQEKEEARNTYVRHCTTAPPRRRLSMAHWLSILRSSFFGLLRSSSFSFLGGTG
jgi:hypothetical protein